MVRKVWKGCTAGEKGGGLNEVGWGEGAEQVAHMQSELDRQVGETSGMVDQYRDSVLQATHESSKLSTAFALQVLSPFAHAHTRLLARLVTGLCT